MFAAAHEGFINLNNLWWLRYCFRSTRFDSCSHYPTRRLSYIVVPFGCWHSDSTSKATIQPNQLNTAPEKPIRDALTSTCFLRAPLNTITIRLRERRTRERRKFEGFSSLKMQSFRQKSALKMNIFEKSHCIALTSECFCALLLTQ